MNFNIHEYPYSSKRSVVVAKRGMVATGQPLAAQAGLAVLRRGGNAVDAAIAAAACLTVVEPTANGIGSDLFAIVHSAGKLYGLNASGPAPAGLTAEKVRQAGHLEMPRFGVFPVTVPGTPLGLATLSQRFGKLPLSDVMADAIFYAEHGFPLSPVLAQMWSHAFSTYKTHLQGAEFAEWFRTFAPLGRAPQAGEVWKSPNHARTLQAIAETNARAFYEGDLAERIEDFFHKHHGYLTGDDLATYQPEWVEPIHVSYRGYEVWELPPNGQGLIALLALNLLRTDEFPTKESITTYHHQIEAMKLAFADGFAYITDPRHMSADISELLSLTYAHLRRKEIAEYAREPVAGSPVKGGTVYLATADEEGMMVSLIQSNYMGFGSGIVIPGTGISMQNRGHLFSLDSQHVNFLQPGKRTFHTIIPGFLTQNGRAIGPFGIMGGYMQPQGHLQVIMNLLQFQMNPQAALDAPRWQWIKSKTIEVERSVPETVIQGLQARGHDVRIATSSTSFGRGEMILRDEHGVLFGATEPRTDGSIASF
ncbi:gamma-glutamyltransferase family protein [Sulfoacidibacillus thermotolerans]|uniref:Gamma-glutamyltransferase n=1 Tax=Sulfoacidibacillus thermotolerans TaxID=1765684 RepID=A0A2U3D9R9_SULT2|nr:gamma-glutamyltransferase family protein [Sulfoacidibacillus thermotolerans]PWI58028.1 gamma-glutamyltransferase [Sulfoacidibacillus thermotolerans]